MKAKLKEQEDIYENQLRDKDQMIMQLQEEIKALQKNLRERDLTIQGKDGEITEQKHSIRKLEAEIQRLIDMNNAGGMQQSELQNLLNETEQKLRDALSHIDTLETTIKKNNETHETEQKRLNTEIDRLNTILKATNQDMANQNAKMARRIQEMEQ